MTPKEKAYKLYDKMEVDINDYDSKYPSYSHKQAKECCIIAIDEIISELSQFDIMDGYAVSRLDYWNAVKIEVQAF